MSPPASVEQTETLSSSVKKFGSTIMGVANRGVDAAVSATTDASYSVQSQAFEDCLNNQEFDDMGKCQYYVDMLANCCRKSSC